MSIENCDVREIAERKYAIDLTMITETDCASTSTLNYIKDKNGHILLNIHYQKQVLQAYQVYISNDGHRTCVTRIHVKTCPVL